MTKDAPLDAFGHVRLGGIGDWLASEIEQRTGKEARTVGARAHPARRHADGVRPVARHPVRPARHRRRARRATSARWWRCAAPTSSGCRWPRRRPSSRPCRPALYDEAQGLLRLTRRRPATHSQRRPRVEDAVPLSAVASHLSAATVIERLATWRTGRASSSDQGAPRPSDIRHRGRPVLRGIEAWPRTLGPRPAGCAGSRLVRGPDGHRRSRLVGCERAATRAARGCTRHGEPAHRDATVPGSSADALQPALARPTTTRWGPSLEHRSRSRSGYICWTRRRRRRQWNSDRERPCVE